MIVDAVLLVWGWSVLMVTAVAVLRSRRLRVGAPPSVHRRTDATILVIRPCSGAEPGLEARLVETGAFVARVDARIVFAVEDACDAARPIADAAAALLCSRGLDARVLLTHANGPNRKADQLARVLSAHTADVVVSIDSDIEIGDLHVEDLLRPLLEEDAALTWVPPVEIGAQATIGDRVMAAVLGSSLHAFTLLAGLDPRGLVGKMFAVRRSALESIGGFDALTTYLGEDVELGRRLLATEAKILAVPRVVLARAQGRSLDATIVRLARWLAVVRAQRPWLLATYPLLFSATLPIVALSLASVREGGSVAPLVVAVVARAVAALAAGRFVDARTRRTAFAWAWAADVALLVAFFITLVQRRVSWRGRLLEILPNGELRDAA